MDINNADDANRLIKAWIASLGGTVTDGQVLLPYNVFVSSMYVALLGAHMDGHRCQIVHDETRATIEKAKTQ